MTPIERTAYPRFRHDPNARELQDLFTPDQDEVGFIRSLIRDNNQHLFAAMLLLKCLQYVGYFPELSEIPVTIVNHVRICLRLSPDATPAYDQIRTMESTQSCGVVKLIEQPGTDVRLVGNPDANGGMHPPAFH